MQTFNEVNRPPMQLDKIVRFHKALADPSRVKIVYLLAEGEQSGQSLAEKLSVSPATITHHASKLRESSLLYERRDKNTVYFSLNREMLARFSTALLDWIGSPAAPSPETEVNPMDDNNERLRLSVLRNFFTAEGKLKHIPAQLKKKLIVLEHLASQLEKGKRYSEKELNAWIGRFHPDFATLRRELIMHQFMYREQEMYELNPREMWTKWSALK